jgi:hypothetical protein
MAAADQCAGSTKKTLVERDASIHGSRLLPHVWSIPEIRTTDSARPLMVL